MFEMFCFVIQIFPFQIHNLHISKRFNTVRVSAPI
jgi:hypothetical protein